MDFRESPGEFGAPIPIDRVYGFTQPVLKQLRQLPLDPIDSASDSGRQLLKKIFDRLYPDLAADDENPRRPCPHCLG
jgi:hypothetical protein